MNILLLLSLYVKRCAFPFEQTLSSLPKDAFSQLWLKLPQLFWRRRFFEIVNVFHYFVIMYPWKKGVLHLKNLNSLHSRIICSKFGWNCPSRFGEEDFLNMSMYFLNFAIISPWKKEGALHLKKLEFPSPKDDLC